jgi:hypothetical protein
MKPYIPYFFILALLIAAARPNFMKIAPLCHAIPKPPLRGYPGAMEQIFTDLKSRLLEITGNRLIKVVLYGSRARGDYSGGSDTDIAIIVQGLTREMKGRLLSRVAKALALPLVIWYIKKKEDE